MLGHHDGARPYVALLVLVMALGAGQSAQAEDLLTVDLTLKDHRFSPSEIHVPQGKPTIFKIRNEDSTADEFDSSALKVEKIVPAHSSATVRLRPLGPGRYPFVAEFNSDTAKGVVVSE